MPFQMKQFSQISCGFMAVFTIWKQKIEKKNYLGNAYIPFTKVWCLHPQSHSHIKISDIVTKYLNNSSNIISKLLLHFSCNLLLNSIFPSPIESCKTILQPLPEQLFKPSSNLGFRMTFSSPAAKHLWRTLFEIQIESHITKLNSNNFLKN